MANKLELEMITQIQKLKNFRNASFLISYSAGMDSTAVLYIANKIFKKLKITNYKAVFFSHTNSPINEGEITNLVLAEQTCKELGIEFHHKELNLADKGAYSWEQYGRMLRHNYYRQDSCDYVLLGHHSDDQDETTLIQLFRGAGQGTSGMKILDQKFLRPFLSFPKKDLQNYLEYHDIEWLDDPTNQNNDLTRNFWRNKGIPTIKEHYPNLSSQLQVIREKFNEQEEISLELAKLDKLDELIETGTVNVQSNTVRVFNLVTIALKINSFNTKKKTLRQMLDDNWLKNDFSFGDENNYRVHFSKKGQITLEKK